MNKLFSNGCSFLTPRPKDGVETFVSKELAGLYGLDLANIAMGGRGNSRISFSTKVWCEQNNKEKVPKIQDLCHAIRHIIVSHRHNDNIDHNGRNNEYFKFFRFD